MRQHRAYNFMYHSLTVSQWVCGSFGTLVAASLKADVAKTRSWFAPAADLLEWAGANAWYLIPAMAIVVGGASLVKQILGPPWVWNVIHSLLDDLQRRAFGNDRTGPLHHHRATLFKHVSWRICFRRWPWSGWLIPVERSGHATRRCGVRFLAPDDADRAEGIAGQTWVCKEVIFVDGLPCLDGKMSNTKCRDYSKKTWVSEDWLQNERSHARSFCGIPVEVKGKLWGVIVLDSRDDKPIKQEGDAYYRLIAKQLGTLLGRG